jgi:hypothetical protein
MTDFIPGSDFVPGITDILGVDDFIPGVTDILGIDDWIPGVSDILGIDDFGITDLLGVDDFLPGIDDFFGGDDAGGGGGGGGNGGGGGGNGGGGGGKNTNTGGSNNAAFNPGFVNLTADITNGGGSPLFDFSPGMSAVSRGSTTTQAPRFMAEGGYAEGGEHVPEFYSEGGMENTYVKGDGDGTSDSVPAMLATGEFVIPADVVSGLGNGDSDSGAALLDQFLASVREHKHSNGPDELPPDSLSPLEYLSDKGIA